jgi:hypothetical protein
LPSRDSASNPSTSEVVRKWLVAFGSLFGREITPLMVSTWCALLAKLTPEQAERGCRKIAESWTFGHFPTPGAILSQFADAEEKAFTLESEAAWERLLAWVKEYYFPDSGVRKGAPSLPAAIQHAARAAGGYAWIERCPAEQLTWCRKTFLAAYRNAHETGQVEKLLGDGEAKRILAALHNQPALLPAREGWETKYKPPVTPKAKLPEPEMTQEQWDARRAFLRAQADEIRGKQEAAQ